MLHYIFSKPVPTRQTSVMNAIYESTESLWDSARKKIEAAMQPKVNKKYYAEFLY